MWRLDVLPDGRIVVSSPTKVVIYSDPLPIVGNETKTLTPSLVIEIVGYAMRGVPVDRSECYFGLDSTMTVYSASGQPMIAVWVPHDGTPPMQTIIELFMPIDTERCVLGLFHGVTMISQDCMCILSYPWGDLESHTGSGGVTRRLFDIERGQDDSTYDVDTMNYAERDAEVDQGESDVLYFSEELGRAIIRGWDCGYFVVDIVV
jgi:hypothetical protein